MLATADDAVVPAQASDLLDAEDAVARDMMAAFDDVDAQKTEHLGVAGGAAETAAGAAASAVLRSADESAPTQQESVGEAPLAALLAEAPTDEAVAAPATVEKFICTKCKLERQVEGSASAGPWFVCKRCNCKRSTLSQLFGYWPVDLFTALPEQQQIAFWRAETKNRFDIQNALVKEAVDHREEEQRNSVGGTYLPLEVWEQRGFDVAKIKAQCKDTEEHPILGTTYNVNLKTVTKDEIRKQIWKDLFKASGAESAKNGKDQKNKKKKKANKQGSSSSSSSRSDSSSSSSQPRVSAVEQRKAAAEKRKADAAAKKEAQRLEKAAQASAAKAKKEAARIAGAEAMEKHKEKLESQASYNKLFGAHAKLVADCGVVPLEKQASPDFATAQEKAEEGDALIGDCLDAMKEKTAFPKDFVKAYMQSLKPVISALSKLLPKKAKRSA